MRDAAAHRRCQCCGARIRTGFRHQVGVAVANPSMVSTLRLVEVLTCAAQYCVLRKGAIAAGA